MQESAFAAFPAFAFLPELAGYFRNTIILNEELISVSLLKQ